MRSKVFSFRTFDFTTMQAIKKSSSTLSQASSIVEQEIKTRVGFCYHAITEKKKNHFSINLK